MIKKTYYAFVVADNPLQSVKSELILIKATSEQNAVKVADSLKKEGHSIKVYTQNQLNEFGAKWLEQELRKDTPINFDELISLENSFFDVNSMREKLQQFDSKTLSKYIIFLSLHNLKLQREIGFESDSEPKEYQKAIIILFTKLADCLDMVDEILDDNLDCTHHIESILDYLKYVMMCKELPLFRPIRYLLNNHYNTLLKKLNGSL